VPRFVNVWPAVGSRDGRGCSGSHASAGARSPSTFERYLTAAVVASADASAPSTNPSAADPTDGVARSSAVPTPAHGDAAVVARLNCVHLSTAFLTRDNKVLLVASRYPNHAEPLWHLPGGRQEPGELLTQTVVREIKEETQLSAVVDKLLYVSESYDPSTETHFTNCTFSVSAHGEPVLPPDDAHIVDFKWVAREALAAAITVAVVREPLLAFLCGEKFKYFGYANAGISIDFGDAAQSFFRR